MNKSNLIISDSGGVQEEYPSLGKSVLISREKTETLSTGTVRLVGTNIETIVKRTFEPSDNSVAYDKIAQSYNSYRDSNANKRIVDYIQILNI
ncbi:MAG: UDP-N-acetylglucosamine 2-epimerase [Prevotellaceae bacterium]|jgi:UDP-N-acetylglucosamine 2-epimerase (non-hydrolysing)|nr:UDP-N-acetylglucosamine 2-epimerase [Prevotellaceae bacterium]